MIIEAREDTITLRGAIKTNIWPAIQAAAALLLENHPTGIIIDCSAVTRITPKGAETLADAFMYIQAQNARIVVAALSPEFLEIGKAVPGVRSQLPVADTVEEARASLQLEEVTPMRGRAKEAAVVPIVGRWRRAVYHADRLAYGESREIHLVDLIKVPLTLPIGTPLPDREAAGQERLEKAAAVVREMGLKSYSHVERVRSNASGLVEFVNRLHADLSVVSLDRGEKSDPYLEESEAMYLLESTSFEVSVIGGAPEDAARPMTQAVVPVVGAWEYALEHACKLVSGQDASVTLVSLIAVPRSQPIDAPKPDEEAVASNVAKEAFRIGRRCNANVNPTVERVRDPILGFLRILDSRQFDLCVVGVKHEMTGDQHIARAIADALIHEARCETVFLRVGQGAARRGR